MKEQRQDKRFSKQYTISYSLKNEPEKAYGMSGLIDISKGGLKFSSYEPYDFGTTIVIHVKLPFSYPPAFVFEGAVVSVVEVVQDKIYKISLKFINLDDRALAALEQMESIIENSQ